MSINQPDSRETIAYSGNIGEVILRQQGDGRIFERYRRPPGTRIIVIAPDKRILVTREYRSETGNVDLRLPGGKVRDTLEAYRQLLESGQDLAEAAKEAAIKEAVEETGLVIRYPQLILKANAGATVEWDLYYFRVEDYEEHPQGQQLEHGEDITVAWMSPSEIRRAVAQGAMQEWRSVGVLLGVVLPELEGNG